MVCDGPVARSRHARRNSAIAAVRQFAQVIFCQDKPILENQLPKRLPLSPRAELPVRADASSAAYRQYLRENDIRFGAIPAS